MTEGKVLKGDGTKMLANFWSVGGEGRRSRLSVGFLDGLVAAAGF